MTLCHTKQILVNLNITIIQTTFFSDVFSDVFFSPKTSVISPKTSVLYVFIDHLKYGSSLSISFSLLTCVLTGQKLITSARAVRRKILISRAEYFQQ